MKNIHELHELHELHVKEDEELLWLRRPNILYILYITGQTLWLYDRLSHNFGSLLGSTSNISSGEVSKLVLIHTDFTLVCSL